MKMQRLAVALTLVNLGILAFLLLSHVRLVCRSECSHACPRYVASGQGEPKSSLVPPEPRVRVSTHAA